MGNSASAPSKHPPPAGTASSTTLPAPALPPAASGSAARPPVPPPSSAAAARRATATVAASAAASGSARAASTPGTGAGGLKGKKRSLELPDFASLGGSRASRRAPSFAPSQPINVPGFAPQPLAALPTVNEDLDVVAPPAHRRPPPLSTTRDDVAVPPDAGPRARGPRRSFVPESLRSSVPMGLPRFEVRGSSSSASGETSPALSSPRERELTVLVKWMGSGADVWVEDQWNGRTRLNYEPATRMHAASLRLPVGNHTLQFLVDDVPKLSPHMRTATDTAGNLVNYIAVDDTRLAPDLPPALLGVPRQIDDWDAPREVHPPMVAHSASTWLRERTASYAATTGEHGPGGSPSWTSACPPALLRAQADEERFLAYRERLVAAASYSQAVPPALQAAHVSPPVLPPAPCLPRHLDKMILSMRAPKAAPLTPPAKRPAPTRRPRGALGALTAATAPPAAVAERAPDAPVVPDDESVLAVPSHVVLHHLGTSAIRDGVLAVADTTRYRRKYITTIYYKPM